MRKHRVFRQTAVLLASILFLEMGAGGAVPYIQSFAYTEKTATVNASSLNVRSGPGTSYSAVGKLSTGASVTVIGEKTASDGAVWYEIRFKGSGGADVTGYVSKSFIKFPVAYTNDADFESRLAAEGFPESYKQRLRQLHAQYPQWVFRAQKTGLDWNTAIVEESKVGHTLVSKSSISSWKSTAAGAYNWDNSTWTGFDGSAWVSASEDIVRYYMDPRNFLDETNIFQFLSHSYDSNAHTVEGLQTMVKNTFLAGTASGGGGSAPNGDSGGGGDASNSGPGVSSQGPGGSSEGGSGEVSLQGPSASITPKNNFVLMTNYGPGFDLPGSSGDNGSSAPSVTGSVNYIDIIMNAGTQSGVNPYVLAAMIIQEQGSNGSGRSVSGTVSGYEGYYNHFNIESYESGGMGPVERGLWWASQSGSYGRPWNSPEKSILGGSLYYGNNYVKVGQDTFYLKKFNVQGSNMYKHQYMTNVQGGAAEGAVYAKAYNDEMKQTALEFKIPVFNNMPDAPAGKPTLDGSPNNKLGNLGIEGFVMTPTFSKDTKDYNLIVDPSVSSINVIASVLDSTASVSGAGSIQLQSGSNEIKVSVTAQNGSVREYLIHVVRQDNGPTYSSSAGDSTGSSGNAGGTGEGPGMTAGPGASLPSGGSGSNGSTPGGSNVSIAPDGSGMTAQSGSGVILAAPGSQIQTTVSGMVEPSGSGQVSAPAETGQTAPSPVTSPEVSQGGNTGGSIIGDINGDGRTDGRDVLKIQRYVLGLDQLSDGEKALADMNGDGRVNAQDVLLLQKKVMGA